MPALDDFIPQLWQDFLNPMTFKQDKMCAHLIDCLQDKYSAQELLAIVAAMSGSV